MNIVVTKVEGPWTAEDGYLCYKGNRIVRLVPATTQCVNITLPPLEAAMAEACARGLNLRDAANGRKGDDAPRP